jgi:alginate O-acetyltransferase complex protein AlgJ
LRNRIRNNIFTGFFCLLLCFPLINSLVTISAGGGKLSNNENRIKAAWPEFYISGLLAYPSMLTNFVNDNFGGRNLFIACNSFIKIYLFNSSPDNKKVAVGKHRWLFLNEPEMHKIYDNVEPLTEAELKIIALVQMQRAAWLKLRHISYFMIIPPIAHSIYEENLPSSFKRYSGFTKREQVINYLKTRTPLHVIDIDSILFAHKKDHRLYFNNDTHWNMFGAYYGYSEIINYIRKYYPSLAATVPYESLVVSTIPKSSNDLTRLVGLSEYLSGTDTILQLSEKTNCVRQIGRNFLPFFFRNTSLLLQYENTCNRKLPSLLMFRDSYTNFLIGFLSQHFGMSTYVWDMHFFPDMIKTIKPAVVIYEIAERFSLNLSAANSLDIVKELQDSSIVLKSGN